MAPKRLERIAEWPLTTNTKVRLYWGKRGNRAVFDLRVWWRDDNGVWRATKRGVQLPTTLLSKVCKVLKKAKATDDRKGAAC